MMHKATCNECGQSCEVPFKPTAASLCFVATASSEKKVQRQCDLVTEVVIEVETETQVVRCLAKNLSTRLSAIPVATAVKYRFVQQVKSRSTVDSAL